MRLLASISAAAALISTAFAGKNDYGVPHLIPIQEPPTTQPIAIGETERHIDCPSGFVYVGRQCMKTLSAKPDFICHAGAIKVDNQCAQYVEKIAECPSGYTETNGICSRQDTVPADLVCLDGFQLYGTEQCIKKVALPDQTVCSAGSVNKGDGCVKLKHENPDYVCPGGFTLIERKCQREETFDCTPPRTNTLSLVNDKPDDPLSHVDLRHAAFGKEDIVYNLPAVSPVVEEYVIQKTCKRIVTEDAHAICPNGGSYDGKMCEIDVPAPEIIKPGGFKETIINAEKVCREGYYKNWSEDECVWTEDILPDIFCPEDTVDLGDKCAIYSKPKTVCPEGFWIERDTCIKTVFTAPTVQYTVTYACTGKDCGRS